MWNKGGVEVIKFIVRATNVARSTRRYVRVRRMNLQSLKYKGALWCRIYGSQQQLYGDDWKSTVNEWKKRNIQKE